MPASPDAFADLTHFEIHMHEGIPLQKKYALPESVVRREGLLGCTYRFEAKPLTDSYFTLRYSEKATRSIEAATTLARAGLRRQPMPRGSRTFSAAVLGAPHVARHAVNRLRVKLARSLGARRYKDPQMFWITGDGRTGSRSGESTDVDP